MNLLWCYGSLHIPIRMECVRFGSRLTKCVCKEWFGERQMYVCIAGCMVCFCNALIKLMSASQTSESNRFKGASFMRKRKSRILWRSNVTWDDETGDSTRSICIWLTRHMKDFKGNEWCMWNLIMGWTGLDWYVRWFIMRQEAKG
jgi:hypothetical protein